MLNKAETLDVRFFTILFQNFALSASRRASVLYHPRMQPSVYMPSLLAIQQIIGAGTTNFGDHLCGQLHWSPLSGQFPDAFRHEIGCDVGQKRIAEIRSAPFQFSLLIPLFRLRARGPPLLPLLRLPPAQTARTETHAMHPKSPCAPRFFCVRRLRGRRGSTPYFSAPLAISQLLQRVHLRPAHYTAFPISAQRVTAGEIPRSPYAAFATRPHRPVAERRSAPCQYSLLIPSSRERARGPPE